MNSANSLWKKLLAWVDGEVKDSSADDTLSMEVKPKVSHQEPGFKNQMKDLTARNEERIFAGFYKFTAVLCCFVVIMFMLLTVSNLPSFSNPDNPVNNEVSEKYIVDGLEDTGAVNIVAGMILDYRAFDTFGESTVLFIAAGAVIILLRNDRKKKGKKPEDAIYEPGPDPILQQVARYLIPLVLIFGIYVVLNGHLSPGGGFSGGSIMGAALILWYNAFGHEETKKFFTYKTFNTVIVCALGFYAVAKSYSFFTGANHIHSIIPKGTPGNILSSGLILPLNIAVGVIVACTMFGFYSLFNREEI